MEKKRMRGMSPAGTHAHPPARRRVKASSHQDAFLTSLDGEITAQESQIRQCRMRLAALRAVRKRYTEGQIVGTWDRVQPPPSKQLRSPRRRQSQKDTIVGAVLDMLRHESAPVPTKTILDALLKSGIRVGGGNPARFLSVVLSTSGRFVAHGHRGWTLLGR